jgi:hypothetical protein
MPVCGPWLKMAEYGDGNSRLNIWSVALNIPPATFIAIREEMTVIFRRLNPGPIAYKI